jgi:hypothetical protein
MRPLFYHIFVVPATCPASHRLYGKAGIQAIQICLDAEACQRNHPTRARTCAPVGSPLRRHPPSFLLFFGRRLLDHLQLIFY